MADITTETKIDHIKRHINMIPVAERRDVLRVLAQRGKMHKLRPTAAGTVFDPAQLTGDDITAVYDMLQFHLNKKV